MRAELTDRECDARVPRDGSGPAAGDYGIRGLMMRFDACEVCGGPVRERRVTVDLRRGERYYPGPVLERLDELAQHAMNGAKRLSVPTFDLAGME